MALDPRFNFVVKCPQTSNRQNTQSTARKDFFNAVGKVGDIELLNKVGDGAVAGGLRTLASISNSIRGGETDSAIIGNGKSGDPNGSNVVLSEVGINPQQAEKAGQFNPGVLNRGTAEAQNVYDKVVDGNYSLKDIPNSVQDLQNLKTLADGIFTEGPNEQNKIELCGAKNYAQHLIKFAPKQKFMFILQFTLKKEYTTWAPVIEEMAFVVKNMGRPNVNIEHEEINFYNFWSRVPKRTVYEPITMRFHDDMKNASHNFYSAYLEAVSPIARLGGIDEGGSMLNNRMLEDNGLLGSRRDYQSSASLGALEGDNTTLIDELRVFHLFDYGRFMSVYNYKNPKILSMNLDDLDMSEGSTGSEVELQFAYDALHITPKLSVEANIEKIRKISGENITENGHIEPVFQAGPSASDEAGGDLTGMPNTEEQTLVEQAGGKLADALGSVTSAADSLASAATTAVSGAISSAQTSVAGAIGGLSSTTSASIGQPISAVADPTPNGFVNYAARKAAEQGGGSV